MTTQSTFRIAVALIAAVWFAGRPLVAAQEARPAPALHAAADHKGAADGLIEAVRASTERFRDVSVAEAEGYSLLFGCVSGPDYGAMGLHYVNMGLVGSGVVDATKPQIVIYEPQPDGHLQLIGADFLVLADPWDKAHPGQGAPQLMG